MYQAPEQLVAINKANLETAMKFAGVALLGAERILDLQVKATKTAIADGVETAKAIAGVKDVQQLAALKETLTQPTIEKAIAYSKSVYEVATQTNTDLTKATERRVTEWNENFVSMLDKAAKNAPAGSDVAVSAVKQMLAAANSAYDNFNKVAKQATEIAEANVAAASETVKGLTKTKKAA